MNWYAVVIVTHVVLTTSGYVGLIATNAWLLALCRKGDGTSVSTGVHAWRAMARVFGPLLGLGVLAGFVVAIIMGVPLTAGWLVATYALIVLALVGQGAMMVPWQRRAEAALAAGGSLSTRPIAGTLMLFCVAYVGILWLMILRP